MAGTSTTQELAALIRRLQGERQKHSDAIEAIDKTFAQFGIAAPGKPRLGRPPKAISLAAAPKAPKAGKSGGRRRRGSFEKTGEDSVLDFVKSKGPVTAAEVNDHWSGEGRGGKADNALSKLVKNGKLKRNKVKGERGGTYSAV